MGKLFDKTKVFFAFKGLKKISKIFLYFFLGLFAFIFVSAICLRVYLENHKAEIVQKINTKINENISGEAKIGDIGFKFLVGFPNFTVVLDNVELRDSLITVHKRPVLIAEEIEVRLDVLKLLEKQIDIPKIIIIDATIDLYKDKNGLSNSAIFKKKKKKTNKENHTKTLIEEVYLKNVNFISENQQAHKLFNFEVKSLKSKINYSDAGWKTELNLNTFVKSLAFNSLKGSFVKDKKIVGDLQVNFSSIQNKISVDAPELTIGDDSFAIKANFNLAKRDALFDIDIKTKIKWANASNLLSNNISSKLNKFGLELPLKASCAIKGDMSVKGDPEIVVHAEIVEDELTTTYGAVKNCSFKGKFTNNFKNGLGFNDANSAVIITDFKGKFKEIPLNVPTVTISNLEKPVATGKYYSEHSIDKLGNFINKEFIEFLEGTAKMKLDFKIDIVDLKLYKPKFTGEIIINNASLFVKSKNLKFNNTEIDLYFTEQALVLKKLKFQDKVNTVFMEGKVDNFLNLYYDAPEKMNVKWKIYSPFLNVKQIVSILTYHYHPAPPTKKADESSKDQLQTVLRKSQVTLDIKVDKLGYNEIIAKDFRVNIVMAKNGLNVNNVSIKGTTGSNLSLVATLIPQGKSLLFTSKINLKQGDITRFLASFNNFGIQSFSPNDIKGRLFVDADVTGILNENRNLVTNSLSSTVAFQIKDGALFDFKPLMKIGKIAFPHRDVQHITFTDLSGNANIKGTLIDINNLKVTSNILNIDAKGKYSLTHTGTNLGVRIPLRNPKDDYLLPDMAQRDAVRYKGVVVNLIVTDGKDGKTKIQLGKTEEEKNRETIRKKNSKK